MNNFSLKGMKLKEEQIHLLFRIGVVIKGIDGALEALAGFALFFTTTAALRHLIDWLTQGELQEDPTDFVATHLVAFFHHLSISTKYFAAVYLLTYGVVKVGLVAGLLSEKLWAYPLALTVLGFFFCYQMYRLSYTHSPGLAFVSVVDFIILGLIWREYKSLKTHRSQVANIPNGQS